MYPPKKSLSSPTASPAKTPDVPPLLSAKIIIGSIPKLTDPPCGRANNFTNESAIESETQRDPSTKFFIGTFNVIPP